MDSSFILLARPPVDNHQPPPSEGDVLPFSRNFEHMTKLSLPWSTSPRPLRGLWQVVLLATIALAVVGCKGKNELPSDKRSGSITGYNHTGDYIHQFYLDEAGGGNLYPYTGGGGFVCCVVYPSQWRQELKVTVKWTTSSGDVNATGDAIKGKWHEAVVPIEKYETPGTVHVHFLPDGAVRVIISDFDSGHPWYPGPKPPENPKDVK